MEGLYTSKHIYIVIYCISVNIDLPKNTHWSFNHTNLYSFTGIVLLFDMSGDMLYNL